MKEVNSNKETKNTFKKFWVKSVNNWICDADYNGKVLKERNPFPSFRKFWFIKSEDDLIGFTKREGFTNMQICETFLNGIDKETEEAYASMFDNSPTPDYMEWWGGLEEIEKESLNNSFRYKHQQNERGISYKFLTDEDIQFIYQSENKKEVGVSVGHTVGEGLYEKMYNEQLKINHSLSVSNGNLIAKNFTLKETNDALVSALKEAFSYWTIKPESDGNFEQGEFEAYQRVEKLLNSIK